MQTRFPRLYINHDAYERHFWTARLLGPVRPGQTVLDVGGEKGLARFLPGLKVVEYNPKITETTDPSQLPDGSFDYAVSIDTLEHVPQDSRREHLELLLRLARQRVVFCAPLGTEMQNEFQRRLLAAETLDPGSLEFVREHLKYGLPDPAQVERLLPGVQIDWRFSGDVRRYMVPAPAPRSRVLQLVYLGVGLSLNWLMNVCWLPFKLGPQAHAYTNRFYGVINVPADRSR
ncbi:MAG: class I SAM-dependent methyltransferase [Candidatus Alcyoniella australis]|nr:class I SAM-dependent methyltransferase [Candidatus Alcyoniella australis]